MLKKPRCVTMVKASLGDSARHQTSEVASIQRFLIWKAGVGNALGIPWYSVRHCHEEITCVMREGRMQPVPGYRIIDITTKAACAVTLKIDWTCTGG